MLAALFSATLAAPLPSDVRFAHVIIRPDGSQCYTPNTIRGSSGTPFGVAITHALEYSMRESQVLSSAPVSNTSPRGQGEFTYFDLVIDLKALATHDETTNFDRTNAIVNSAAQTALAAYTTNLALNMAQGEWKSHITFINVAPYKLDKVPKSGFYTNDKGWTENTDESSIALKAAYAKLPKCS